MTDVPAHWTRVPLGALISGIEAGKNVRCEERPPKANERGLVKISAVTWGEFDPHEAKTLPPDVRVPSEALINNGDLLISRANTLELVGATVIVKDAPNNLFLSDKILRIRADKNIAEWLNWYLRSAEGRQEIEKRATGNQLSMRNISQEAIRSISVPIPPLSEQYRIMMKLSELTKRIKSTRAELDRVRFHADHYKHAVMDAAFSGKLTEGWRERTENIWSEEEKTSIKNRRANYILGRRGSRLNNAPELVFDGKIAALPKTWIACCLADVADIRVGYAFKSSWFSETGPRLLRGANIAPGQLVWNDGKRLSSELAREFGSYILQAGDIVIAMDRPIISSGLKIAVVGPEDAGSLLVQRVANPILTRHIDPEYLLAVLNSDLFINQIKKHATGSDLPHISSNDILTTPLPLPPIPEQREIAGRLKSMFSKLTSVSLQQRRTADLLSNLDRSIYRKAFQGGLVA